MMPQWPVKDSYLLLIAIFRKRKTHTAYCPIKAAYTHTHTSQIGKTVLMWFIRTFSPASNTSSKGCFNENSPQ